MKDYVSPKKLKEMFRFAVYDSFGKFLGYKVDSFWSINKTVFKEHTLKTKLSQSNFVDNLTYSLNKFNFLEYFASESGCRFKGEFNNKNSLYVVAEDILSEEGIAGICIFKNNVGDYSVEI